MGMLRVVKKSNSGSTRWVDTVYFNINTPTTYASYVLLKNYYWEHDKDNLDSIANRMRMIGFSRKYLTHIKETTGDLCCAYCPKTNLIIEMEGMKVPNKIKATIDHILATSKGGDLFNYDNLTVACGTCNSKKSDMPVEEFVKKRENNLVISI